MRLHLPQQTALCRRYSVYNPIPSMSRSSSLATAVDRFASSASLIPLTNYSSCGCTFIEAMNVRPLTYVMYMIFGDVASRAATILAWRFPHMWLGSCELYGRQH